MLKTSDLVGTVIVAILFTGGLVHIRHQNNQITRLENLLGDLKNDIELIEQQYTHYRLGTGSK